MIIDDIIVIEPKSESFLQKYLKAKHDLGSEELRIRGTFYKTK